MAETVKFYPELVLAAMRSKKPVGGVRLFCIAKHRDNGNGHLPIDEFKAYTKRYLGMPKARYNRWLREASQLGIIKRVGGVYALSSWGNAAAIMGIEKLHVPVEMGVTKLAGEGSAAWVWAAYLKRHEYKPIARATLKELTGVPERTQIRYEAEAGVENIANYADFGFPDENPDEAITEETDGWFWYYGRTKKRLSNSRIVNGVERCKRGRTDQHNRTIWAALSLWDSSQPKKRLYFHGPNKAQVFKKTLLAMRKSNEPHNTRPNVFYLHSCNVSGVGLWDAIPCN